MCPCHLVKCSFVTTEKRNIFVSKSWFRSSDMLSSCFVSINCISPRMSQVDNGLELHPAAIRPPRPSHALQVPGFALGMAPDAGWKCLSLWTLTRHLKGDLFWVFRNTQCVGTVGARMIDWIGANWQTQLHLSKQNHNLTAFRSAICQD